MGSTATAVPSPAPVSNCGREHHPAHVHGAVRALQSIPTPLRRGTVDIDVQMDTGERVWTTNAAPTSSTGTSPPSAAPNRWAPRPT